MLLRSTTQTICFLRCGPPSNRSKAFATWRAARWTNWPCWTLFGATLVFQSTNPDHEEYAQHRHSLSEYGRAIEELIQQRLVDRGIRFPVGGLEHGLLDFPTTLDGRWVYLCWQSDEPEVAYWHEVSGGYAGRRRITAGQMQRLGRLDDPARREDSALDF